MKEIQGKGVWPCRTCHHYSARTAGDFCTYTLSGCARPKTGCSDYEVPADQATPAIRMLVCGPINYMDRDRFAYALDMAWRRRKIAQVIHWGGQIGRLADGWCTTRGVGVRDLSFDERRSPASVEAENSFVLETGTPQAVIVFPGESHRVQVLLTQLHGSGIPVWHPFGE